jgi:hypothetical protein
MSTAGALVALAETAIGPPWCWIATRSWTRRAFGGLSGIVYRNSSTLLEQACGRTGRRSRAWPRG